LKLSRNPDFGVAKCVGVLAVTLALVPWVSFGLLHTDSAPWPLFGFFAFLVTIRGPISVPKNFWIVFVLLIFGICISLVLSNNAISWLSMRAVYNYMGAFTFFIGFFNYLLRYGFPLLVVALVNLAWILFGLLELYSPDFVSLFAPIRTTLGRGVTSLSPEATFFATYLFFSSWLLIVGSKYQPSSSVRLLLSINVLCIFFLAKSAMGIVYLGLTLGVVMLHQYCRLSWSKKLVRNTVVGFLGLIVLFYSISHISSNSRFLTLGHHLLNGLSILDLFRSDESMNSRLEDIVYSIHGSIDNFLIPGGFDVFLEKRSTLDVIYNGFFMEHTGGNKIMSWIGDWMYQLGIFGLVFVTYIFYVSSNGVQSRRLELLLLGVILLSAIPLAFPLVMMLFATFLWDARVGIRASSNGRDSFKLDNNQ
jgi:hypothetical protein